MTAQIPIPPVINSSPGNVATPQIRARAKVDPNSIASSSSPSAPRPTIRSTPSTSSLRSATSPSLNSASFTRPSLPHHASSSKSTASGINTPTQARLVRAHSQTPPISPASPSISMGPPALLHRGMTTPVPSRIRTGIAVMADSSPEIPILHRGVSEDSRSAPLKARVKMDPGFDSPRRASTTSNSHHELSSSANSSISGALRSHPPASTQMATEPGVDTTSGLSKSTSLLSPANVTDAPGSTFLPHYPPQTYFSAFHDENHHAESRMHMTDTPEPLFSPHMEHSNTSPPHLPHLPLSAIQTQHFPFPHFQHPTASCPPSPAPPSSRIPGDPSDTTSHQSDRLKSLEESELRRSSSIGHERSLRSFAMSNTGDRTRNRIPLPTHPNQGPILPPPPLSPTLRTIDLPFITPTRSRTASVQSPLPCVSPGTGLGFNHGSIPVPDMEIEQVRRPSGGSGSDLSSNSMSDPTSNPRHRLSSITRTDIENELISQRRSERDRLSGSTMVDEEFDGGTSAWNEGKRFVSDGRKIALREISPGGGSPDELDIVLETNAEQAKINRKVSPPRWASNSQADIVRLLISKSQMPVYSLSTGL